MSTTRSLGHESEEAIGAWISASIAAGLIVVTKEYRTLKLTGLGWDVINGRVQDLAIHRPLRAPARVRSKADTTIARGRWQLSPTLTKT